MNRIMMGVAVGCLVGMVQWPHVARALDDDDLSALLDMPSAADIGRELDGMLSASDHNAIWRFANRPGMDFMRDAFGAWFAASPSRAPRAMYTTLAHAAGRVRAVAAVPVLCAWLQRDDVEQDAYTRESLLYALGEIGDREALATIEAFTMHEDEWTRFFAREAVARIAGDATDTTPRWPGTKGLSVAVVGRGVWSGETDHYYKTLLRETFNGRYGSRGLVGIGAGFGEGWRGGIGEFIKWLRFDDQGEPLYDVVILHGLWVSETTPLLLWRLYHYARRGGRVVIDTPSLFWRRNYHEGNDINRRVVRSVTFRQGPWDALYPERMTRHPVFPPIGGLPPPVKRLYYGYQPLERGGSLLISPSAAPFARAIGTVPGPSFEPSRIEPFTRTVTDGADVLIPRLLTWLGEGPRHRAMTLDWQNEPVEPSPRRAGSRLDLQAMVTRHQGMDAPMTVSATVASPRGERIAHSEAVLEPGAAGEQVRLALDPVLPGLTEPGRYHLRIVLADRDGADYDSIERELEVAGRFDLKLAGVPTMISDATEARVVLTITDRGSGPIADGQVRLQLVDEDTGRLYRTWSQPWAVGGAPEAVFDIAIPEALPPAQYLVRGEIGDRAGRVFGASALPLARQAPYDAKVDFLWSEWSSQYDDQNLHLRREIGLNTTYGWGSWSRVSGFPHEYAVINPPQYMHTSRLGDYFLGIAEVPGHMRRRENRAIGRSAPRAEWIKYGHASLENARAVSVNMVEEVGISDQTGGVNRRDHFEYFLQEVVGTVDALNQRDGTDILAWEELPFADLIRERGRSLSEWFGYWFRNHTLHMRADWMREGNRFLRIEPGMGAGGAFYDAMHMRGYVNNRMTWFPLYYLSVIPDHGREAMTWLVGMQRYSSFAAQARVAWSAIAANGRHLLNYAPGDYLGETMYWAGGRLSPFGRTYREVIRSIRPYEPILAYARNRISTDIASLSWSGIHANPPGETQPALETLLAMSLLPAETMDVGRFRVLIDAHGRAGNWAPIIEQARQAVEDGAVLLATPDGSPELAAAFGVRIPDRTARGAPRRVPLDVLAGLLPGLDDAWLYGDLGPAEGVAPESGLTMTDGLIYGRVGDGLFLYINVASTCTGARYTGDWTPWDWDGWTRLLDAVLKRQDVAPTARAIDVTGRVDRRFACRILDTDDGSQRYALVQANDVLEGSLSGWRIEDRMEHALARFAPETPVALRTGASPLLLEWNQSAEQETQLWIKRRMTEVLPSPSVAAEIHLIRERTRVLLPGFPVSTGANGSEPTGRLRGDVVTDAFVWEAAGPVLPLTPGDYAIRIEAKDREVVIEQAVLLPAEITARIVWGDDRVHAVYDARSGATHPIIEQQGQRYTDLTLRAGDGALLALLETPGATLHARVGDAAPGRGGPLAVTCELRAPDDTLLPQSHVLRARLLAGADRRPVPQTEQTYLLEGGRRVIDFWIAASDPEGETSLQIENLTTGERVELPLTLRDAGGDGQPHGTGWDAAGPAQRPEYDTYTLEIDPLPDLREPDIGIFHLAGRFYNVSDAPIQIEVASALPDACFPEGPEARVLTAAPRAFADFRILTVLTRRTARAVRRKDLTIPVWIKRADGAVLAEHDVRLLINPWEVTPPTVGTLDGGTATLRIINATDRPQRMRIAFQPPDALVMHETNHDLQIAAGREDLLTVPLRRRDAFVSEGLYRLPYRVTPADGGAQTGETRAELRTQSRWLITQQGVGPRLTEDDRMNVAGARDTDRLGAMMEQLGMDEIMGGTPWDFPAEIFEPGKGGDGWTMETFGASLWLGNLDPLPAWDAIVMAATRIVATAEHAAVTVRVGRETSRYVWLDNEMRRDRRGLVDQKALSDHHPAPFMGRIWVNGEVVYDSRLGRTFMRKPFALHRGENTVLVQLQANTDSPADPGNIFVFFNNEETGKRIRGLIFDAGADDD